MLLKLGVSHLEYFISNDKHVILERPRQAKIWRVVFSPNAVELSHLLFKRFHRLEIRAIRRTRRLSQVKIGHLHFLHLALELKQSFERLSGFILERQV